MIRRRSEVGAEKKRDMVRVEERRELQSGCEKNINK